MEEVEVQTVDEIVMDKVAVEKVVVGKVVAEALQFAETIVALEFPVVFVPENNQISEPVLA